LATIAIVNKFVDALIVKNKRNKNQILSKKNGNLTEGSLEAFTLRKID